MGNKNLDSPSPRGFTIGSAARQKNDLRDGGVIGRRIVAYIIDIFILFLASLAIWFIGIASFGLLMPVAGLILIILPFLYHSLMIASSCGATLGQRFMNLRVTTSQEEPVTIVQALILTALFYASLTFTSGIILLWCLFDDRQRCLHDILAGTITSRVR